MFTQQRIRHAAPDLRLADSTIDVAMDVDVAMDAPTLPILL